MLARLDAEAGLASLKKLLWLSAQDNMVKTSDRRRFFVTISGRLGLISANVTPGDRIIVAARVPFIIRKVDGYFNLGKECYIHGIMHGEALEKEKKEQDE